MNLIGKRKTNMEEDIEVEVRMPKEILAKYNKMSKKELQNRLYVSILKNTVQKETIADVERTLKIVQASNRRLHTHINNAKGMIEGITRLWF